MLLSRRFALPLLAGIFTLASAATFAADKADPHLGGVGTVVRVTAGLNGSADNLSSRGDSGGLRQGSIATGSPGSYGGMGGVAVVAAGKGTRSMTGGVSNGPAMPGGQNGAPHISGIGSTTASPGGVGY